MMLNIAILCDDADLKCGQAFIESRDSTLELMHNISNVETKCLLINSNDADKYNISTKISAINVQPFICFAYCHGTKSSLLLKNQDIVSVTDNNYIFTNAFMCAFNCYCAGGFADTLLANGLRCFLGYESEARFPISVLTTIDIEMEGVKVLVSGGSIQDMYNKIIELYDQLKERILERDPIIASVIMNNREGLRVKGETNLRLCDFYI
ncbi:MAG: hypothetical protein MJZ84_02215 [Paludibacteraceae bacterium]|nr:hypothetical protein [Paludibacteraceae bacterium]